MSAEQADEHEPPKTWAVIDPYELCPPRTFATEDEAIKHANGVIESMCDDESWDENVQDVAVVRIHHVTIEKVLGVRAEMTKDAWDRLTGGSEEHDRWLDYVLMPADHSGSRGGPDE